MLPRKSRFSIGFKLIIALIITLIVGCKAPEPISYNLDTTPLLSGGLGWAVISGAYVRLKVEPGFEAGDGDYARRGEILSVVATERAFSGRNRGTWYKLEGDDAGGWLHQSMMAVYPSLERARNASKLDSQNTPGVAP